MAQSSLSTLFDRFGNAVWRADALADAPSAEGKSLPSGHAVLDAQLPGAGWPVGALCEILQAHSGQQEWRLLLPALRTLAEKIVLVGTPYVPFGPGLAAQGLNVHALLWVQADAGADRLWVAEQALRCAGVSALLVWLPQVRSDHLRRLHLAAQAHAKLLFVMRPAGAQHESSPAVLRLLMEDGAAGDDDALPVQVLKRRGPPLVQTLTLPARASGLRVLLSVSPNCVERGHALDCLAAAA